MKTIYYNTCKRYPFFFILSSILLEPGRQRSGSPFSLEPVFTTLNMPPGRIFSRHTSLNFLDIHKVCLRKFASSGEKISRPFGIFGCEYRFLMIESALTLIYNRRPQRPPVRKTGAYGQKRPFCIFLRSFRLCYSYVTLGLGPLTFAGEVCYHALSLRNGAGRAAG